MSAISYARQELTVIVLPEAEIIENDFAPAKDVSHPAEHYHGTPITVLLAEERTMIRQGMDAILDRSDNIAVVGQAPDFHQLSQLAEKLRPNVVIMAFSMALKNGLETVRRLLGDLCGARVLVLVPHNDDAFGDYIAASGASGYLSEESCSRLLATAVREVHEKNKFFPCGINRRASIQFPSPHRRAGREKDTTQLTTREAEVLQLIAEGNANKQTASKLGISIKTVEKHRQHLMDKLRIHETATLTRYALYAGIAR